MFNVKERSMLPDGDEREIVGRMVIDYGEGKTQSLKEILFISIVLSNCG